MSTPYYTDDTVTLFHGDCREITEWLDAGVLVTDPPYGKGHYESDRTVLDGPMLSAWTGRFTSVAVFGWPETLVALCVAADRTPSEWITWWPTNGALRGRNMAGLWRESEHIAIFGATPGSGRLRRPRASVVAERMAEFRGLSDEGARLGDVWRDASPGLFTAPHLREHPNMKPIQVMRRLVEMCSEVSQVIVDPFAGSGTTLRAAKDLGRCAIGVEIEERYCEIAARRLSQEVLDFGEAV